MTIPPKPETQWVENGTRVVCTVSHIANTKEKAPLPPMVVYTEESGKLCAEFVDNFLNKRKPFDPEVGHAPEVEIVMPNYQVFIGTIPARMPPGVNYYIDATYECSVEEATLECRRVIDATYKRVNGPPAGVKNQPIFDKDSCLKFVKRQNDTRTALQEQCANAGINWVGIVQGTPMIWGNRMSNGASIHHFMWLASCLRYAFRCTVFLYEDSIAGESWRNHFGDAWKFFQSSRWEREGEGFRIDITPGGVLNLRLSDHWFPNEAPVLITLPTIGADKGKIKLSYVIQQQLLAMYNMTKITGGIA